jgi:hypothetical protein
MGLDLEKVASDKEDGAPDAIVTPAMIDAGVTALGAYENDEMWCSVEDRVAAIFRAMVAARSKELNNQVTSQEPNTT